MVTSVYGMLQVLMPAVSLQQRGTVCLSVTMGIREKRSGLPGMRTTWVVVTARAVFFILCRGCWVWV
jgi:hypothetical protein